MPEDEARSRIRFFLVGRRLYQVMAITMGEAAHTETLERFFDSFEVIE